MSSHISVLASEALELLNVRSNLNYVDCTLGGGGHTKLILEKNGPKGKVLAFDLDTDAIENAQKALKKYASRLTLHHGNFTEVATVAARQSWPSIDGALYDLGISTDELRDSGRGFSFQQDEPLDMRLSVDQVFHACDLVNTWREQSIADAIFAYGEERYARRIAKAIVEARHKRKIETTNDLVGIIRSAVPNSYAYGPRHFATRTFQALRIAVNDELDSLESSLQKIEPILSSGARLVVISFHSLEDRIVKNTFRAWQLGKKMEKS